MGRLYSEVWRIGRRKYKLEVTTATMGDRHHPTLRRVWSAEKIYDTFSPVGSLVLRFVADRRLERYASLLHPTPSWRDFKRKQEELGLVSCVETAQVSLGFRYRWHFSVFDRHAGDDAELSQAHTWKAALKAIASMLDAREAELRLGWTTEEREVLETD